MHNVASTIGLFVKEIAEQKNLKPSDLGKMINTSKQNISDIYKRKTIDSELLLTLSKALEYNIFSYYDHIEPISLFRAKDALNSQLQQERLETKLLSQQKLIETQEELLNTQRKYIIELENKDN